MHIRSARLDDALALACLLIDTGRATYRGQIPDAVLYKLPLDEAYAELERNWRRSLQGIADGDNPRRRFSSPKTEPAP